MLQAITSSLETNERSTRSQEQKTTPSPHFKSLYTNDTKIHSYSSDCYAGEFQSLHPLKSQLKNTHI